MGTGQVRHFRGCEIPDQLLSLWKGLCFFLLGFTKMQIAGSQEIKGSHYLARKVLKLTVSRCSHQDINGTQPESWPKKLKTIQVSLSLPLEILTILSARLHSPGIQRTSLSQIFQLSVVTIQYCRWLYRSINPAQKMQWKKLDRLAEFSFVNMIVICAGNLEPDCENQSQDPKHLHRLWGLLQVF